MAPPISAASAVHRRHRGVDLGSYNMNPANIEVRNNVTNGVLKPTLYPTRYDWEFIPIEGRTFTDPGSAACVVP